MQIGENLFKAPRQSAPALQITTSVNRDTSSNVSLPDRLELESLMLNMDASLRVHARHQFFTWTQGLLQNLIKHELLMCALRNANPVSLQVDSFATSAVETKLFSDLFRQDASVVPQLIQTWEDNHFQPVTFEMGNVSPGNALVRELNQIGADVILAHGTYDAFGKLASFFVFACRSDLVGPKQVHFVELVVPFLQLAWMRTRIDRPTEGGSANSSAATLTPREQEILKWIQFGKSNIEIGAILEISPLTVKNHVQKMLRKLNVQNRAQAVGKALALRILSM
jgi:transcriptional regulator EpsA